MRLPLQVCVNEKIVQHVPTCWARFYAIKILMRQCKHLEKWLKTALFTPITGANLAAIDDKTFVNL
jgi:hypothetical protein